LTRVVTVIGTDGSGKTTLTDLATERLSSRGLRAERVWLGAESHLMKPARSVLRILWAKRAKQTSSNNQAVPTGQSTSYREEIAQKNHVANQFRFATQIYVWLAITDYRLQIAVKLWRHRKADIILADRYVFDVCVNIGLALGWTPERVVELASKQLSRFPLPQVRVFLRVEPAVSMSRKDDIPDPDYLALRLRYYDEIAAAFGFAVLDGTDPIDRNCERLVELMLGEYAKVYVHYVHSNNTDIGGADKVLALMAQHSLRPSIPDHPGHRVSVSLRETTSIVDEYRNSGIPVLIHSFVRPQVSGKLLSISTFAFRAPSGFMHFRRLLSRERPDLVHVNDLYDFIPAIVAKSLGIPVVFHLRMIKTNEPLRRAFLALLPIASDVTVSVSAAVRGHYFSPLNQGKHRAEVIYDLGNAELSAASSCIAEAGERPDPLPAGGLLVLMVGRIEPWKAQHIFVEAVGLLDAEIREANVFALVGGRVAGKEDYADQVALAAESVGVLLLGERDDVPDLLRAADISVHCSTSPDPFPGVVIESLLAGAATIAADAGGVPEIINSEVVGIRVPPGNAAKLAAQLEQLVRGSASPRHRYSTPGRARALELVDPKEIDRQILALYRDLVAVPRDALPLPTDNMHKAAFDAIK
jgi:glycosyltransferase involved in cell wall biosynthesis